MILSILVSAFASLSFWKGLSHALQANCYLFKAMEREDGRCGRKESGIDNCESGIRAGRQEGRGGVAIVEERVQNKGYIETRQERGREGQDVSSRRERRISREMFTLKSARISSEEKNKRETWQPGSRNKAFSDQRIAGANAACCQGKTTL